MQQSYLRYLYPAFALLMALAARIVAPTRSRGARSLLVAALPLVAANLDADAHGHLVELDASACAADSIPRRARATSAAYADQRPSSTG